MERLKLVSEMSHLGFAAPEQTLAWVPDLQVKADTHLYLVKQNVGPRTMRVKDIIKATEAQLSERSNAKQVCMHVHVHVCDVPVIHARACLCMHMTCPLLFTIASL